MTGNETVNLFIFKGLNKEIKDMAKNSKIAGLVLGSIFAATALTAANDAMALDRGCQNADTVRAGLQTEGQYVVVSGIRPIPEQPKNIFTTNKEGTLGYNVEQGTGDATGKLCVGIKYTDIKLNADSNLATPSWALMGANTAHNQWISETSRTVENKILMGATILRDVNGEDVKGAFMMVTRGNTSTSFSSSGSITVSTNSGNINPAILLANVEKVQPNYDAYVQAPNRQLAALTAH